MASEQPTQKKADSGREQPRGAGSSAPGLPPLLNDGLEVPRSTYC